MRVAILGASDNPERYSHRALVRLRESGHAVFPVHPRLKKIEGLPVFASLSNVPQPIDTLTLYVGPEISSKLSSEILATHPKRLIFNPGAENPELEAAAAEHGIKTLRACTLTLLATKQFEQA